MCVVSKVTCPLCQPYMCGVWSDTPLCQPYVCGVPSDTHLCQPYVCGVPSDTHLCQPYVCGVWSDICRCQPYMCGVSSSTAHDMVNQGWGRIMSSSSAFSAYPDRVHPQQPHPPVWHSHQCFTHTSIYFWRTHINLIRNMWHISHNPSPDTSLNVPAKQDQLLFSLPVLKFPRSGRPKDKWSSLGSARLVSGLQGLCLTRFMLHSERRGGIATAPPLRRSYSDRAVMSPGGAFQTDTNLANHRHRNRLLADCQWRCRWRCGLGRLRNTRSLTKTIPRDRRKLIKLMLRKWTFPPPRSHLIRQFVKRHLVTLRREQHVLAQWLRQYFCQDHGVRSVGSCLTCKVCVWLARFVPGLQGYMCLACETPHLQDCTCLQVHITGPWKRDLFSHQMRCLQYYIWECTGPAHWAPPPI